MKKTIYFLLSLIFFVSCYDDGDLRKQLQDLEDRVANLAGTVIASINDQVTGVEKSLEELDLMDAELQGYIAELEAYAKDLEKRLATLDAVAGDVEDIESELAAVKEAIEVLKESDDDLDERTAALKSYVDDTLKSSKDWAESTFTTLAQYDTLQTEISMIKSTVKQLSDEIVTMEADFGQDLSAAIAATETGMKTWVNEQLALSYYDAASINVKLDELVKAYQDADAALQTKIEDQQKALDQAKEDLTEAYTKAISDAIGSNGGVIDAKVAEAIKTAQDALKNQIDDINTIVNELEDRLVVLESNLAGRIQNMSYVPEYADGKVTMLEGEGRFNLKFLVKPERLAAEIQDLWEIDNKVVKANLYYSKHPVTKSDLDAVVPLTVLSLEASADGYIDVLIGVHPEHPLLEDFWDGEVPALTYVHISDGNNDFATDMVVLEGQRGGYSEVEPEPEPGNPLETTATANCYIITRSGTYTFPAVKGNSVESVGNVASAEVLWESFGTDGVPIVGDLIASVSYSNGRIGLTTAQTFRKGNAVVAAKDASGKILWSWHIWMTDQPKEQVYYNGAGTVMDRNLGATSTVTMDEESLGLLYQWGRKDPFLGSSEVRQGVQAASTITWPSSVVTDACVGTIEYTLANPTTFIEAGSGVNDWKYEQDNTLWGSTKTIYDPCPVGWRVADGGVDGTWTSLSDPEIADKAYYLWGGMDFANMLGPDMSIWYPAASVRLSSDWLVYTEEGDYWTCTPSVTNTSDKYSCVFAFRKEGSKIFLNHDSSRYYGFSVRCLKEESDDAQIPDDDQDEGDMTIVRDLTASSEAANSYIVSKSGSYKFPVVKGNGWEVIEDAAKAEVLWESFGTSEVPSVGDLIASVSYSDGYIAFSTATAYREGNAVIAVKNSSDKILWSWHIWMTDQPAEHIYYNKSCIMIDRNLGATSATPGEVGSLGLFYQWGRKDPFLGSATVEYTGEMAASTIEWPSAQDIYFDHGINPSGYDVSHPTSFLTNENYREVFRMVEQNPWYFHGIKGVADPCPAGWRVPDGGPAGVWQCAMDDDYEVSRTESDLKGLMLYGVLGGDRLIWYPAVGRLDDEEGTMRDPNMDYGGYWSSTTYMDDASYVCRVIASHNTGALYPSELGHRAEGNAVRCMKERME